MSFVLGGERMDADDVIRWIDKCDKPDGKEISVPIIYDAPRRYLPHTPPARDDRGPQKPWRPGERVRDDVYDLFLGY